MVAWSLFKFMLLEDWRMHSELFGGARFALFPVQIAVIVGVVTGLLTVTPVDPVSVVLGVHAVVLLFGVHLGSSAFEGNDALENVFGDVTYLLFSTRTLPVSTRTVFGVFLMKDVVYYSVLFILPITVGLVPLYVFGASEIVLAAFVAVFVSLVLMFVFGAAMSVIAVTALTTGVWGKLGVAGGVGGVVAGLVSGVPVMDVTPYGLHTATSMTGVAVSVGSVIMSIVIAITVYSPGDNGGSHRGVTGSYASMQRVLPGSVGLLPVKMLMDVRRSSGGLLKVGFVAGVLFTVAAFVLWGVESALGIHVRPGVAFGSLLSLTAFTTYTWLTQLDEVDEYTFHPVSVADVFRAKYVAFVVLTVPVGVVFYGAAVLYYRATVMDAVTGGVIFTGLSVYVFGVTVLLAGLDPNEFMFDTVAYSAFAVSIVAGLVPVVIVSFIPTVGVIGLVLVAGWCLGLGVVGAGACWAAPQRWGRKYRAQ